MKNETFKIYFQKIEIKFGSLRIKFYLCIPFQKRWEKQIKIGISYSKQKTKLLKIKFKNLKLNLEV